METNLEQLPLLTFNEVLFPFTEMSFHVSQPSAKALIHQCMRSKNQFGFVLERPGSEEEPDPYLIGTLAKLTAAHLDHATNEMDVTILGTSRFRIRRFFEDEKGILTGFVEPIVEEKVKWNEMNEPLLEQMKVRSQELVLSTIEANDQVGASFRLPDDPVALSFMIASFLQLDLLQKQKLLETTNTLDRIEELLPLVEQAIETWPDEESAVFRLQSDDVMEWVCTN